MKRFILAAATAGCLTLAACGGKDSDTAVATNDSAISEALDAGAAADQPAADGSVNVAFPAGARIIEEDGVTYRIGADGARVRLGPTDSRIVVENGVRYRVDPDDTRVKIDDQGAAIDLPDVDVGINSKGNLDVDVGDKDPDGGR